MRNTIHGCVIFATICKLLPALIKNLTKVPRSAWKISEGQVCGEGKKGEDGSPFPQTEAPTAPRWELWTWELESPVPWQIRMEKAHHV